VEWLGDSVGGRQIIRSKLMKGMEEVSRLKLGTRTFGVSRRPPYLRSGS
jgi:hypothetical protein